MSKKLVAYFSASGVTASTAKKLAEAANADLYEIRPEIPYTVADLDWRDKNSRSTLEMQNKSSRPAIADKSADIANYDVIFVGFPVWWYTAPTIINTFLESYDFSGKTILPLCTHEGSRMGSSERAIASLCPNATLLEGLAVRGASAASARSDVETWLNRSGIL